MTAPAVPRPLTPPPSSTRSACGRSRLGHARPAGSARARACSSGSPAPRANASSHDAPAPRRRGRRGAGTRPAATACVPLRRRAASCSGPRDGGRGVRVDVGVERGQVVQVVHLAAGDRGEVRRQRRGVALGGRSRSARRAANAVPSASRNSGRSTSASTSRYPSAARSGRPARGVEGGPMRGDVPPVRVGGVGVGEEPAGPVEVAEGLREVGPLDADPREGAHLLDGDLVLGRGVAGRPPRRTRRSRRPAPPAGPWCPTAGPRGPPGGTRPGRPGSRR